MYFRLILKYSINYEKLQNRHTVPLVTGFDSLTLTD